jgi:hypothetical protein
VQVSGFQPEYEEREATNRVRFGERIVTIGDGMGGPLAASPDRPL